MLVAFGNDAVKGRDDPQVILSRLHRTDGGAGGGFVFTNGFDLRPRGLFVVFERLYAGLFRLYQPLCIFEFVSRNDAGRG